MNANLFQGKLVRLTAEDAEGMAEAYTRWALDSEYLRLLDSESCMLWSTQQVKKLIEKNQEMEPRDLYTFMIRTLVDNRLIGHIGLDGIQFTHGDAFLSIGVGERDFWGKGYGTDALRVLLRLAFTELNLGRLSLDVFEYNPRAIRSYEKAGFSVEGRMRGFLRREGTRWDLVFMGILRAEWLRLNKMEAG